MGWSVISVAISVGDRRTSCIIPRSHGTKLGWMVGHTHTSFGGAYGHPVESQCPMGQWAGMDGGTHTSFGWTDGHPVESQSSMGLWAGMDGGVHNTSLGGTDGHPVESQGPMELWPGWTVGYIIYL